VAQASAVDEEQEGRAVKVLIKASFDESRKTYGSPRIHEDLLEAGEKIGRNRVIRLMQSEGLEARARKRFKCTTMSDHDQPIAANILDRDVLPTRRTSAGSVTRRRC
jgi:transposase InsO family protein